MTTPNSQPAASASSGRRIDPAKRQAMLQTLEQRGASFVATLVFASGKMIIEDPLSPWKQRSVEQGAKLASGCKLTVRDGRALVRLNDGSDLWLSPGAVLDLSPWALSTRHLRLLAGHALALVAHDVFRPFRVLSRLGAVQVTGTSFSVSAGTIERPALDVAVLHGGVLLQPERGDAQAVTSGRLGSIGSSGPLAVRKLSDTDTKSLNELWPAAELSASAKNPPVATALAGLARTLRIEVASTVSQDRTQPLMNSSRFALLATIVALFVGGGYYWHSQNKPAAPLQFTKTIDGPIKLPNGMTFTPKTEEKRQIKFKLRGDDGQETVIELDDPSQLEAHIAKLPPEVQAKLREKMKDLPALKLGNGEKIALGAPGQGGPAIEIGGDGFHSQIQAGISSIDELVAGGMTPEQARATVEAALADSLTKQIGQKHEGANVKVHTSIGGAGGEGGDNVAFVAVAVNEDVGGPEGETPAEPAKP